MEKKLLGQGLIKYVSGVILVGLMLFLPAYVVQVPDTVTENAADAAAMNRSVSVLSAAMGRQPMLNVDKQAGLYGNVLSGDLLTLESYSGDGNNIRGIFRIPETSALDSSVTGMVIMAAAVAVFCAIVVCVLFVVNGGFWLVVVPVVAAVGYGAFAFVKKYSPNRKLYNP